MSIKSDMANAVVSRVSDGAKDAIKNKVNDVASGKNENSSGFTSNDDFSTDDSANNEFSSDGKEDFEDASSLSDLKDSFDEHKKKKDSKDKKEKSSEKDDKDGQSKGDKDKKKESPMKKLQKASAGAAVAGGVAQATLMAQFMAYMKMLLQMLMSMIQAAVAAIMGAIAAVISTIVTAVTVLAAAIGVSVAVATLGVVGVVAVVVVGIAGLLISWFNNEEVARTDSMIPVDCATAYFQSSNASSLDATTQELEYAKKIYSFFHEYGLTDEQIAGILGNWSQESGIDPTGVETIYDEKYQIGNRKEAAMNADFLIKDINADYAKKYPAIEYCGIGLGQWTNGRNRLLISFASAASRVWYDLDVQLAFCVSDGGDSRASWFNEWRNAETKPDSPEIAAKAFCEGWEGISWGGTSTNASNREQKAAEWYACFGEWEVDADYANSIIEMAGATKAEATDVSTKKDVDNCISINKVNNSSIAYAAVQFAWATKEESYNDGTALWQAVFAGINPGDGYYRACCRTVSTAVKWSGADNEYCQGGVQAQLDYLLTHIATESDPQWMEVTDWEGEPDNLEPGDVLLKYDKDTGGNTSHTIIYVGHDIIKEIHGDNADPNAVIVHGSLNSRSPACDVWGSSHSSYRVFRCIKKEVDPKYKNIGVSISVQQSGQ